MMPPTKESGMTETQYLEAHAQGWRDAEAFYQAERDALRGELADTETEKIERGTEILRLREALNEIDGLVRDGTLADIRRVARNALERPE
jgi:hypothetical protein